MIKVSGLIVVIDEQSVGLIVFPANDNIWMTVEVNICASSGNTVPKIT
jgi:hypothetical protein